MNSIRICSVKLWIIPLQECGTRRLISSKLHSRPALETITLGETLRQSAVDVLLLCFFAVALTTVAFLKFFRSDI